MLETTWFAIWGVAWAVYFMLDGFDLGLGLLSPFISKSETERRIAVNAMGPFWDGNEVWLITAGGVTFAAFPAAYALMFSALYTPLMMLLFALILRGVAFEFRGKVESASWRKVWDGALAVGSGLAGLLLGVAFANLFAGIPVDQEGVFQGNLFTFLNPYGLAGGVFFLVAFVHHGALWLAVKTNGELRERSRAIALRLWVATLLLAVAFLALTAVYTQLWTNLLGRPGFLAFPVLAVVALVASPVLSRKAKDWAAWGASAAFLACAVGFGVAGLFPTIVGSSLDPAYSATAFNSASSPLTLKIMLGVALSILPLVIAYQTWVYVRFGGTVTKETLEDGPSY
ncbi:MAG: cytochrome d ubiquinol oxidase subunit II [Fibrobacterota bacterium]|nr:MAG: cytochrome d ubiquinol oxidase subunit II [Fibrobacterota bacterium]